MNKIYSQYWMTLPQDIRRHLVNLFKMNRSSGSEVRDNTVISDGYTNEDLENINEITMCEYLKLPLGLKSFPELWTLTLGKVNNELHPIVVNFEGITLMPEQVIPENAVDITPVKEAIQPLESPTTEPLPETLEAKPKRKYVKKNK